MTRPTVTFTRGGKPLAPSWGKLSSLAYFFTGDEAQERITTKQLRALLAVAGIDDPTGSSMPWHAELPNGEVIGAHAGRTKPKGKPVVIRDWKAPRARAARKAS